MNQIYEQEYINVLHRELVPALGCTEPIAIAYAAAKVTEVLGSFPEHLEIRCSGNIIKNVKAVVVPNSNGLRGVEAAAVLGAVGGNAERKLEVLEEITSEHISRTQELLKQNYCTCSLQQEVANLYIVAIASSSEHTASVTIINRHTFITEIQKDGEILYQHDLVDDTASVDWSHWNVKEILEFANHVNLDSVKDVIERQIELNSAIADEGLNSGYGAQIGRTILKVYGNDVKVRARARAAAGSDARMGGCSLPVVINSGSGNQGMTVSLPVIEFAKEWKASEETLYRALVLSNLISVYHKHFIGSLSAFCGAVTAACGCGSAITYLSGGGYEEIARTIINTVANVGGIVCDGAKASCAAKIASAVDAAILGHCLSMEGLSFQPGEGIIQESLDETIKSVGYIGRVGMKETDLDILKIMMTHVTEEF